MSIIPVEQAHFGLGVTLTLRPESLNQCEVIPRSLSSSLTITFKDLCHRTAKLMSAKFVSLVIAKNQLKIMQLSGL